MLYYIIFNESKATMIQRDIPNSMQAFKNLVALQKIVLNFDLIYQKDPDEANVLLTTLQNKVTRLFESLPHPDDIILPTTYSYEIYYACLHNLYHNPLVLIDFGSQRRVNNGYLHVINQAAAHFNISHCDY